MEPSEYLKILKDPILWADYYLKWKPRKFQEEYLHSTERKKIIRIGRRCGKTESMCVEALFNCFTRKNCAVLFIAPYNSQIIVLFEKLDQFIDMSDDIISSVARKTNSPWLRKFHNGSYVRGWTTGVKSKSKGDTVRGSRGDLIYIDEADRCSQDDLDSVLAILGESVTSRVVLASTPTGKREFFFKACFLPGTPVLINGGEKNIEDVHVGDDVLGMSGFQEKVTEIFCRDYEGEIVNISVKGIYKKMISTPEHPLLVIKKRDEGRWKPEWISASEIKLGDFIGITVPKLSQGYIPFVDSKDIVTDRRILKNNLRDLKYIIKDGYSGIRDKRRTCMMQRVNEEIIRIKNDSILREYFMEFVGYYIAEGNIIKDKVGSPRGVMLTFRLEEDIMYRTLEIISKLWPSVNCQRVSKKDSHADCISIFSSCIGLILRECCGEYASGKKIHSGLFGLKEFPLLVDAYWKGDGYRDKHGVQSYITVSKILADQIFSFHLSRRERTSLYYKPPKGNKQAVYTVSICNKQKSKNMIWYYGMPFVRVSKINRDYYSGKVFNIETDRTHTYSANGFAVHNCTRKELNWQEFHYPPSYCLPHWTPELEAEQKGMLSDDGYTKEWLGLWGEETEGVFKKEDLDVCHKKYSYLDICHNPKTIRTLGVDWDKYQAGPNLCITEYDPETKRFKVIYRTEIPVGKFRLDDGVKKIIELNAKFEPAIIYVDRGFGEYQIEILHKYGQDHPESGLHKKLKGISYSEVIPVRDPGTKEIVKKNIKHWAVNLTCMIVERHMIDFSTNDKDMKSQLENYRVVRQSEYSGPVYNSDQEHAVDALFLSILALMTDVVKFDVIKTATQVGILSANPFNPSADSREISTGKSKGIYRGLPIYVPSFSSVRKEYEKRKDNFSRKI